jgi:ADP-ribosylglycohydrolase
MSDDVILRPATEAILSFLDSNSYEDAVRNAVSLGGDSGPLACIAGGIAEAFYGGVPQLISDRVMDILDEYLSSITIKFVARYGGRENKR